MQKITIIGGGIAGLTTAIALKNIGIRADVYEAAPAFKPLGAGLLLAANAIQGYQNLGIAEKIISKGHLLPYFKVLDQNGKVITSADAGSIGRKYGLHNFAIHRADLHEALVTELDADQLHTNHQATGFSLQTDGSVLVHFESHESVHTEFVIASDGIHSPFRKQLLPHSTPRYAGYTCWRAVVDARSIQLDAASETWGAGRRFGIVPLADHKVYWFACVNAPENDTEIRSKTIFDVQGLFQDFHAPIPDLLRLTRQEDLLLNDIIDLEPIPQFAFGPVVLIGDAAHATTPNMGQGACQAIEDAVVLAQEIKQSDSIPEAFKNFEKRRLERTHWIVNNSWRLGKIAQWENPFLMGLRNALFRMMPAGVNERQMKRVLHPSWD
ncbi:MAG: FAD-dependent monooxygenase [Saprospiraceae bacterium]|nr:FAD-dependent monooxygenase [Saprospiraceae bacterium]